MVCKLLMYRCFMQTKWEVAPSAPIPPLAYTYMIPNGCEPNSRVTRRHAPIEV